MSAEEVALIPQCAECNRVWLADDGDRWQALEEARLWRASWSFFRG